MEEEEDEMELHDDAIAMLFLIAERNNPESKWRRYFSLLPPNIETGVSLDLSQ
ncbi:hypothetical protein T484DRAFT_1824107, partial [Baffinella frigidus]